MCEILIVILFQTIEDFILLIGTFVAFIAFILWCCFPIVPKESNPPAQYDTQYTKYKKSDSPYDEKMWKGTPAVGHRWEVKFCRDSHLCAWNLLASMHCRWRREKACGKWHLTKCIWVCFEPDLGWWGMMPSPRWTPESSQTSLIMARKFKIGVLLYILMGEWVLPDLIIEFCSVILDFRSSHVS